ncbi:hypothetical protein PSEUBRA_003298 [Kalmanozyma brasiliensis GHG001]|uniref:uncharacterized protein n=1 Tax=Kalmanozyma brasiliensis (strain GHG001) TaxID=1365824 RepID=UPI002867CA69|nr:uncharacterized protein PSEUBRA_003298 [Kalmanozyma brasiliensis GHG001]KAF6767218.1 hypothetical protein PSEUBRA_003298 [Kalmanozyma brasiliensis GHG001]
MTLIRHQHLFVLLSACLSLICFQAGLVRSGVGSSSRRQGPYVLVSDQHGRITDTSDYLPLDSPGSSDSLEDLGPSEHASSAAFDAVVTDLSNQVLERSAEILPSRLRRLGYPSATVSVFKDFPSVDRHPFKAATVAQLQEQPERKQLVPLFGMDGMRTYAMAIDDVPGARWPIATGRYAGRDGVTKAVVFSMFRHPQPERMQAMMKVYGVIRIMNAPDLHRPSEQARLLMHDLVETARV